ncbi:MAG: ATP synthase subunit I [Pseudomonadota bacterium]|nr:ATP synthase subunit I [Pseudomonadota bacterium]
MHDPIAAGRRSALKAVVIQAVVAVPVALAFFLQGPRHALAAGIGGLAMVLGNALAANTALAGIVPARIALSRLLLGVVSKWVVAISIFAMGLAVWRLPPLPMLVGLAAGLLAYLLALNFVALKSIRKTSDNKG